MRVVREGAKGERDPHLRGGVGVGAQVQGRHVQHAQPHGPPHPLRLRLWLRWRLRLLRWLLLRRRWCWWLLLSFLPFLGRLQCPSSRPRCRRAAAAPRALRGLLRRSVRLRAPVVRHEASDVAVDEPALARSTRERESVKRAAAAHVHTKAHTHTYLVPVVLIEARVPRVVLVPPRGHRALVPAPPRNKRERKRERARGER